MRLLAEINKRGTTVVMATHDQHIVNAARRRVLRLDRGRLTGDEAQGRYS